jgi:hypothetical protein
VIRLFLLAVLAFGFGGTAFAGDHTQGDSCGNQEQHLIDRIHEIFKQAQSVDGVLGQLPREMRERFIFMTDSRSAQEASYRFPRVILKSPLSEVTLTFNTHPQQRGYDQIEMIYWNSAKQTFEFEELKFESGAWSAKLETNPRSCINCHQSPARPNWDPYRLWAGQTPFQADILVKDSLETDLYLDFVARAERKEGRFRFLIPAFTKQRILDSFKDRKQVMASIDLGGDGFGAELYDAYSTLNKCRIEHSLRSHPAFPAFGPAVWAIINCGDSEPGELIPQDVKSLLAANQSVTGDLRADTERRQKAAIGGRQARQRKFFETWIADAGKVDREMTKVDFDDTEISTDTVAQLRFLLEPLGVNVKNFSMSLDEESYTFGDRLRTRRMDPVFLPVLGGDKSDAGCSAMAAKSREALSKYKNLIAANLQKTKPCVDCEARKRRAEEEALRLTRMEDAAVAVFKKYGCAQCHSGGNLYGAPPIPFTQGDQFKKFLSGYSGSLLTWSEAIWTRINLPETDRRHMPKTGPSVTDPKDLAIIRAYLVF